MANLFTALKDVLHNGKHARAGATMKLSDEQAAPLLELKAVEPKLTGEPVKPAAGAQS